MSLPYYPRRGEVLICDFDSGFRPPEMVKRRPIVVLSSKQSNARRLCTVVPFSTTQPEPPACWHHCLPHLTVPGLQANDAMWAKCDMIATVGFDRLSKPYVKTRNGRAYRELVLAADDMLALDDCLRKYLRL